MVRKLSATNPVRRKLVRQLKKLYTKEKKQIWKVVAEELAKPRRMRRAVNVSRINRHIREGEIAVVPGRVLGSGKLEKPVTVVAESFSLTALEKIKESGGKAITLRELVESREVLESLKSSRLVLIG